MNPAYTGCTCECHRNPGMLHMTACCTPSQGVLRRSGPVINLDLDGVFADFLGYLSSMGIDYHASPAVAWAKISLIPRFYTKLPVLPGSLELLKALEHQGDKLRFLSALPLPTGFLLTSGADKRQWVRDNLTTKHEVMTVLGGQNKFTLAGMGDVLIDDQEKNLVPWVRAGGIGIHHVNVEKTLADLRELGLLKSPASETGRQG